MIGWLPRRVSDQPVAATVQRTEPEPPLTRGLRRVESRGVDRSGRQGGKPRNADGSDQTLFTIAGPSGYGTAIAARLSFVPAAHAPDRMRLKGPKSCKRITAQPVMESTTYNDPLDDPGEQVVDAVKWYV